jgi:DNA polymerase-3 subunit delta'
MKPYEARLRVVIISDAQAMNPEAGNALLKVLEEPPDHTILILITMQRSDLLPTIVSRCRHIRFSPIPQKILEALLVQEKGVDPDEAIIIAAMANGSFTKAVSMSQTNWINKRNWLIKAIGLDQPESLSSKPLALILAFAERLSQNREILLDSLEIIKSWLRDLVIYKYYPEKIINKDLADKIQYASQKVTVKSLLLQTEAIQTAQKNIQSNANLRLTLDVMATRLARLSNS